LRKIKVVIIGKIVATTKDQNNNAVEIQDGNKDASNKTPIKILFSNVKLGKNNKPPTNPAITDNKGDFTIDILFKHSIKNWKRSCAA